MVGLTAFVRYTQLGKASRAVAFDREAAEMMGIDVDRVISTVFFVGSALAGVAGVMFGLIFQNVFHFMGFEAGPEGLHGRRRRRHRQHPRGDARRHLPRARRVVRRRVPAPGLDLPDVWVFFILIAVMLLIRPTGLLGKADIRRA